MLGRVSTSTAGSGDGEDVGPRTSSGMVRAASGRLGSVFGLGGVRGPATEVAREQIRQTLVKISSAGDGRRKDGMLLTVVSTAAISTNALYLGLETELAGPQEDVLGVWLGLDMCFTLVFTVELIWRAAVERSEFVRDGWNLMDIVLVSISIADAGISLASIGDRHGFLESRSADLDMISVMRSLRIVRVVRVFKVLTFFKKLWLLTVGVMDAMRALVWAWILLGIIIYIFGILMTRMLGKIHGSVDEDINDQFGTVPRSMFTMFQIMTLDGWPGITRNAMKFEPWILSLILFFMLATTYSIMNVIVAVIVNNTLEQATNQKEDIVKQKEDEARKAGEKIREVFTATDVDESGDISKEEFVSALKRRDIQEYLKEVGIDVRHAENLFDILDFDDSGTLDAEEWTTGVMRARGPATAKDILALQCNLWRDAAKLRADIEALCRRVDKRMRGVDEEVNAMYASLRDIHLSLDASPT